MPSLKKHARSPHSPSPIYGIRPGFTVADLDRSYTPSISAIAASGTGNTSGGTSSAINTNARAIKVSIIVTSSTTTDHVDITIQSAIDSYGSDIATYANLAPGSYEFYLGGWATVDSDNSTYPATKYGPPATPSDVDTDNPTGDQDTDDPALDASSNYVGGTYNPFQFLSLDGYALKATSKNFSGSPSVTVSFDPLS